MDFYIDFCLELTHIDEVGDGEAHVVKQMVERLDKMQFSGKFGIQPFVPVGRWAFHACEIIEGLAHVRWKCQRWQRHTIFIERVPSAVADGAPQIIPVITLNGM